MGYSLTVGIMKVVQTMFFVGLIGCAAVVMFSWVSIVRDGFSKKGDLDA